MSEIEKPKFTQLINLAALKLGAEAVLCSDDFFASMNNLVLPGRGVFIADKYTDKGKWMDGWESRRKRTTGHDWCIIKLGAEGTISGVDVDTNHFLGNHPPYCSIEAVRVHDGNLQNASWVEILSRAALDAGSHNYFEVNSNEIWSHVKLHIYPDGGVARLKVYGAVKPDWDKFSEEEVIDLASALNGAKSIGCNDMFFSHMDNLLMPGKGENMGDGWETKRNRNPNNRDWVTIRLAHPGEIQKVVVDTHHFKGNYPDSCDIQVCKAESDDMDSVEWVSLLDRTKLSADQEHVFEDKLLHRGKCTHARLRIYPDGGISRLRLFGVIRKE